MTGRKRSEKDSWVMVRVKRVRMDVKMDRIVKGRKNNTKIYQTSGAGVIKASRRRHI